MPFPGLRPGHELQRVHEITDVLLRHGLGYVARQLGLPSSQRAPALAPSPHALPASITSAMEELGPTFVKLGQMLSARPDLLPPEWTEELSCLQDRAAPFPAADARALIEEQLGGPLDTLFRSFDAQPLGAAAIAQVHRAELPDGTPVAVKVQRPGVADRIDADLGVLREIARLAEGRTAWGRVFSFTDLVEQFAQEMHQQLDFSVEGRHADHVRSELDGEAYVIVPAVHWTYTTSRVLTLDFIAGRRLAEVIAAGPPVEERRRLAATLVQVMLRQALHDGIYHADPHPGNLLVTPDGRLALLDFGMVGFLDPSQRDALAALVLGLAVRDAEEMALALQDVSLVPQPVPQRALQRDLQRLFRQYYDLQFGQLHLATMLQQVISLAAKYQLRVPPELGQFVRMLIMVEGVSRQLDSSLSVAALSQPVLGELRHESYSADRLGQEIRRNAAIMARLLDQTPTRLHSLLQRIEAGQLPVIVEQGDFERRLPQVGRLANRLALALLVGSLLLTSGLLLALRAPPLWAGVSTPGLGLILLGLLGAGWLVRAVWRSGGL